MLLTKPLEAMRVGKKEQLLVAQRSIATHKLRSQVAPEQHRGLVSIDVQLLAQRFSQVAQRSVTRFGQHKGLFISIEVQLVAQRSVSRFGQQRGLVISIEVQFSSIGERNQVQLAQRFSYQRRGLVSSIEERNQVQLAQRFSYQHRGLLSSIERSVTTLLQRLAQQHRGLVSCLQSFSQQLSFAYRFSQQHREERN